MRWAAVLQKELLEVAWPEAILSWPDCEEVIGMQQDGREALLWRGLRVRIGMACGRPQYRKPLNTGAVPQTQMRTHSWGKAASAECLHLHLVMPAGPPFPCDCCVCNLLRTDMCGFPP